MYIVRQGAVSSPVLFCIYIDKVIKLLRTLFNDWMPNPGCLYGQLGICWVYAGLLSPSRTGLKEMVKICENFAKATKLKFSTNIRIEKCKTICLILSKERINYNEITPILLNFALLQFCIRFLSNLCKNGLNTVLGRNLFSIANDCSVNPSDHKMLRNN